MASAPLSGIKVLEFTHAVMGPCTGLMLADNGADVILVEPVNGISTRRLKGFGTGYFSFYNRNKESLAIDLKSQEGIEIVMKLAKEADVIVENFGPGTMDRLGLGYEDFKKVNEAIIYCSLKGFLPGPYEKRHAMDEVVQMMGGLAYMTGRSGDPLRAGTSVIDITGGMFGYIGILTALYERAKTGEGGFVKASLYETCTFLMGQHMAYQSQVDYPIPPMPERVSAWSIYKIFNTKDGGKVFIGIISERHWERMCEAFNWQDWAKDERLKTNNDRIDARGWFIDELESRLQHWPKKEIIQKCEENNIPVAPITRPGDLFEDEQLNKGNSLIPILMPNGRHVKLPKFPLEYKGERVAKRSDPPEIGSATLSLLTEIGLSAEQIAELRKNNLINEEK